MLSSTAVFTLNLGITSMTYAADSLGMRSLTKLSTDHCSQRTAFTQNPAVFYIRRDRTDRHRVANVFDSEGNKVYTIERRTMFSPIWSVYETRDRIELSTMRIGLLNRSVDYHGKPELKHRDMVLNLGSTGLTRRFYLSDGAPYEWSRSSKYLERIINVGGQEEEIRQHVALVRPMRTLRFDFELLVDDTMIDPEVAITTGYIAMNTLWGIGEIVDTQAPTRSIPFQHQVPFSVIEGVSGKELPIIHPYQDHVEISSLVDDNYYETDTEQHQQQQVDQPVYQEMDSTKEISQELPQESVEKDQMNSEEIYRNLETLDIYKCVKGKLIRVDINEETKQDEIPNPVMQGTLSPIVTKSAEEVDENTMYTENEKEATPKENIILEVVSTPN